MLFSWLLSDTWHMTLPARALDTAVCACVLWLVLRWLRCGERSAARAWIASGVNTVLGIGLYAVFTWVRDTGAVPWRGPLWLLETFLGYQTVLFFLVIVLTYRREAWRAVVTAVLTPALVIAAEVLFFALLSALAPHAAGTLP